MSQIYVIIGNIKADFHSGQKKKKNRIDFYFLRLLFRTTNQIA